MVEIEKFTYSDISIYLYQLLTGQGDKMLFIIQKTHTVDLIDIYRTLHKKWEDISSQAHADNKK